MPSGKRVIVVIGAARSGTKFLRDSLAAANRVVAVPYDIGYVWRFGNEAFANDAIPESRCSEEIATYIRDYVRGFGTADDYVVEKTVGNSLRVDFVRRVFPEAKFVLLIRDGRAVVESSYRQWQEPPNWRYLLRKARTVPMGNLRYGIKYAANLSAGLLTRRSGAKVWGPRYPGIERDVSQLSLVRVCARQWARCVQASLEQWEQIDPENKMTVRYEDLVWDRDAWVDVCRFAGIADVESVLAQFNKTVRPGRDRWTDGLTAVQKSEALDEISDLLVELGY